jgi:uncharacterized protein YjbJ (UPF0337 family)
MEGAISKQVGFRNGASRIGNRRTLSRQRCCPGDGTMNWDQVEGNWKQLKGRVQQQWGKLTDDDVDTIKGKRVELVGKIQERYGVAREKAEEEVESFCKTCN